MRIKQSRNKTQGYYYGKVEGKHFRVQGAKWYLTKASVSADGCTLKLGKSRPTHGAIVKLAENTHVH